MTSKTTMALIVMICMLPLAAKAETEPLDQKEIDEVVVTATRTERTTEDVPAAVSVVTEERLKDLRLLGAREALQGLPGVQAETRNGGYDARLIIRGAGLKARYGVREIMILLDGVPITDPDGMSRLDFVDTQLIERVDVVRGPNSTLYGANASGGVINVITRNPYEERKSLKVGYGSDNTQLYNALYGTSFGNTYLTLAGSRKSTDGWREWNEFDTNQGSLKLGHLLEDGTSIDANLSVTEADLQLPGKLTKDEFDDDPSQLTSEIWRHSGRYSNIYSGNIRMEKELGSWKLKPLFYAQTWDHDHPVTGGINDGGAWVYGLDLQSDYSHQLGGIPATLTTGVAGQIDESDGDKYKYRDLLTTPVGIPYPPFSYDRILYTLSDHRGTLLEESDDTISRWGVYAQESLEPSERWIIDLGIRYDQVRFDLDTTAYGEFVWGANFYADYNTPVRTEVDETFDYVSPRLGIVYKLDGSHNLYSNISTGFQTPQSGELEENPHLDPSRTINYEVGVKGRYEAGHQFDLGIFYQEVKDEIVETLLPDGETQYSNAGQTNKFGIEFAGELHVMTGLYLGGTYTYSDFEFDEFMEPVRLGPNIIEFDRSGNQLPYVPKHQYSTYLKYRHSSGFKFRIDSYTWGEYEVDNANSETFSGYDFLTNALVGWENEHWDLTLDVQNISDKQYAMEVTKSGTELQYRPGAPRTYFAKASYKF